MSCDVRFFDGGFMLAPRPGHTIYWKCMPTVRFTESIQRHVECPTREVAGETLRHVLEGYFQDNERARGYVRDAQGSPREHGPIRVDARGLGSRRSQRAGLSSCARRRDTRPVPRGTGWAGEM